MADKFDPYREALIIETKTIWPDDYDGWEPAEKHRVATALHADPENASDLEYVRQHAGFCRVINVTEEDIQRV